MASFVLIHGGGHGAWCWGPLMPHLEAPALSLHPELAAWRSVFDSSGLEHARLTGSGSSFFALYEDPEEARAALELVLEGARDLSAPRLACVTAPAGGVSLPL